MPESFLFLYPTPFSLPLVKCLPCYKSLILITIILFREMEEEEENNFFQQKNLCFF